MAHIRPVSRRGPCTGWPSSCAAEAQGLRAGQVVITGTYAGAPWVPVGPTLQVRFGHLGTVTLRFQTRPRG